VPIHPALEHKNFYCKYSLIKMSSTDSSSSLGISDIVGIVIGGVIGLVMIISLIFSCYAMCCKKNNQAKVGAQPDPYYPPNGAYGQPMNTGYYPQQPPYQQPPYQQPPYQQSQYNKQPMNNDQPPSYSAVNPGSNAYGKY
jgi:hypothetical protein